MKSLAAFRPMCAVVIATVMCLLGQAAAQTVTPPNVPGMTVPFPYLYLNAPTHWGFMAPQNANPTQSGFLQSVPVTRVVGGQGVHWGDIMTAPPVAGDGNVHYDAGLKGLGMNYDASISGDSDCSTITNQYWWPMATCFSQNGHYSSQPNDILYTFYTVPTWASVINGTHGSPLNGWNVASSSASCAPSSVCSVTLSTTGFPGIYNGTVLVYSVAGTTYNETVTAVNNTIPTAPVISFSRGSGGSTGTSSNSFFTFTNSEPPSDANNATETCVMPDGNAATGHCFFKEYVTWMMMHTCRDASGHFGGVTVHYAAGDSNALSTCVIHYWEGWNEFNSDGFWRGNYTQLAQMMNDAAYIIHQYCNNCYVAAGSVTAGGDAGHVNSNVPKTDGSGVYIEALGQLLHDWQGLHASTKPDILSIHPYPGYDNIYMPAMPETNMPVQWDPSVAPYSTALAANSCSTSNVAGCINICTYSTGYKPTSATGCTAYVENPRPAGTAGDAWAGAAAAGCGSQTTSFTAYVKASTYTSDPSPLLHCRDSFVNDFKATRTMLSQLFTVGDLTSSWISTSLPIWNTESGWGTGAETNFLGANAVSLTDPHDGSLTTFVQQSYAARMGILAAEADSALNLWYQWDIFHTNSACSAGVGDCNAYPTDLQSPWQDMGQNWGQLGSLFTAGANNTTGSFKPTRVAYTWNRVEHWLNGATFSGTAPTGTRANGTFYNYGTVIYDGQNVHTVKVAGTSGSSTPDWNKALYGTTADGSTLVWEDMGDANCRDLSTFSSANVLNPNVFACSIIKTGGYKGTIAWYTPFDNVYVMTEPAGQNCLKDIDGGVFTETTGSTHHVYNRPVLFDNSTCNGPTDGLPESDYTP